MAELFDVTGLSQCQDRLQTMVAEVPFLMVLALRQEAEAILAASQPLVPWETGSLQESGKIDEPFLDGAVVETAVRYGGTVGRLGRIPERYAIFVHELVMNHPRGGTDHFLSRPFFETERGMFERLAEALWIAL